jgi:hypothetical protein
MALNPVTLGAEIAVAVANMPNADRADITAVWRAIATAIVAHIQLNAVVTVTSVSGVTTGAGVSGPGVGSIT